MNIKFDKVIQLLEAHVDKLVLGVICIVALFLLWVYVFSNPYGTEIAGTGKKMGPADIDPYVKRQADQVSVKLGQTAPPSAAVDPYARMYRDKLKDAIPNISTDAVIPYPGIGEEAIQEDRLYAMPAIPDMTDCQIVSMRGAARVPDEDVGPDKPYESVPGTQADVDLVTVSARLDIDALYNNFETSFMGPRLKSSWKDPRLAKPVFARLQLQRRRQLGPGQWGPWENVPPSKVETYRQRLMDLPFTLSDSQFGVDIWKAQFDVPAVQRQVLQPPSYQFTISRTDWMPPQYLNETLKIMEETKKKEKREEIEARRSRIEQRTNTNRRNINPRPTTPQRPENRRGTRNTMGMGMGMGMEDVGAPQKPQKPKERTVDDVTKDYKKELLDDKSVLKSRREPLLVWATDDTVDPGQTYQYRIRVGLFNPIAGKDWFEKNQQEYKDQVVLWSPFAEPADSVSIPRRFYVFPTDVLAANDGDNGPQGAKIEVMKYHLGQWRDHKFDVYPGEIIGYEVDTSEDEKAKTKTETPVMMPGLAGPNLGGITTEEEKHVDFGTGYTLIDIRSKISWGSRLRPDSYSQVLYFDGSSTQILPIGQSNWDRSMRDRYRSIQGEMEEDVQRRNAGMMDGTMEGMPMMSPMEE